MTLTTVSRLGGAHLNAERNTEPEAADRTVLVVEDEVLTRMVIAEILRDTGFRVVEAGNAAEALRYLHGGGPADLVFADVEMPGAMNGVALARHLRAECPDLKVILTSGGVSTSDIASTAPFIPKPYALDHVVARIRAALTEPYL